MKHKSRSEIEAQKELADLKLAMEQLYTQAHECCDFFDSNEMSMDMEISAALSILHLEVKDLREVVEKMDRIHDDIMTKGPSCTCGDDPDNCKRCSKSEKLSEIAYKVLSSEKVQQSTRKAHIAVNALIAAAQDFCEKVESGRARSTDSYNKFKAALKELS